MSTFLSRRRACGVVDPVCSALGEYIDQSILFHLSMYVGTLVKKQLKRDLYVN